MHDVGLVAHLLGLWRQRRAWAEDLLCRSTGLEAARFVLFLRPKGVPRPTLDPAWHFTTHGGGVRLHSPDEEHVAIDFDFNAEPSAWDLGQFARAQVKAGALNAVPFGSLLRDHERMAAALAALRLEAGAA